VIESRIALINMTSGSKKSDVFFIHEIVFFLSMKSEIKKNIKTIIVLSIKIISRDNTSIGDRKGRLRRKIFNIVVITRINNKLFFPL
jgi:hypothetical protein